MKISVIGCGRWGSFITWYLDHIGHELTLYGREGSKNMQRFMEMRTNDYLTLPESIRLTNSLPEALANEIIVISIGSQNLDALCRQIAALGTRNKTFVLCMKGIETGSCRRLSVVAGEALDPSCSVAVWLGPGHVQEFVAGVPNCMVIDSTDNELKGRLIKLFGSELIRFYYGSDLIGNEIGAASKNVIGIAAGILDGRGLGTLKGALMSRGTREIARLIKALGGNELSAYGLCHLGDYEATVFSPHSHNRSFGEAFARGESYGKLAEGYYTCKAVCELGERCGVELPICSAIHGVLYEGTDIDTAIEKLFHRDLTMEF
ncbi:MAG: NAD(P)H-dependent glycerol-3-phosphate dehydrogenase [Oscillospiraceae bacterium]|nr:NAD(P)H-dependent glycerol-3-phosphate dehydrogenase [Oscillospiraceae bacterium]